MAPKKRPIKGLAADKVSPATKTLSDPNKTMIQFKLANEKKKRMQGVPKKMKIKTGFDPIRRTIDVVELKDQPSVDSDSTISSSTYDLSSIDSDLSDSLYNDEEEYQEDEEKEDDTDERTETSTSETIRNEIYEKGQIELEDIENFLTGFEEILGLGDVAYNLSNINVHKQAIDENANVPVLDFGRFMKLVDDIDGSKEEIIDYKDTLDEADVEEFEEIDEEIEEEHSKEMEEEQSDEEWDAYNIKEDDFSFDLNENDQIFEEIDEQRVKPEQKEKESEASAFVDFLAMQDTFPDEHDVGDIGFNEIEEQICHYIVQEFLQSLIDECVNKSEIMDLSAFMKRHLNKRKLLIKLNDLIPQLNMEQSMRQFLNQKCVEYYRRLKAHGRITDTQKGASIEAERQYIYIINELDKMLGRERATTERVTHLKAGLMEDLEIYQNQVNEHTHKFENLVNHTLNQSNSPKIQMVIDNSLRNINETRKEVTNWRLKIIQRQHTVASLHKQLRELEDLGNGLSMATYDTIQTDNVNLYKKLEERTADLNRLRYRCHSNIHAMAHLIEKVKMLRDAIIIQKAFLEKKQFEKDTLRERIASLKIQHSRIRKEIREWSFRSGLLDKPIVLADYYKTIKEVQRRSVTRTQLRAIVKYKRRKIEGLEQYKCRPPADFENILLAKNY